ncbi:coiled-coil domain-containing protein 18 isoform X1 [Peromyscus maniculatus bairdii]|uniref:coiled-coil domain-containing protein 18 isoform X1 n=2 Tax=Peromyscus maniculatus bairdii TaxID=230844 RepID=UPI00077DC7F8|nr:coiled-coil domain-containing protein 18 isoform X1 [Peromyscus maniculatus bairdii]XP_015859812.1 coiled-coil domain-containing protein 18 isoform X1 [Peromyscus maniculatus bairdii]XP_015859813.1 coiled-coil domain-containing protein 18 isoform X1 [Peromyscus maniculatus bairdii]XP_042113748.1 coiled-coil domain-containing protein 18 isoform X1 [Peromyscus maniculatus bairdii]XP_042113749.1 coiled-coil domain-containing protein 18 isoform X1 [Peromyscus maniculatus bairdii]XP_042113750.1 
MESSSSDNYNKDNDNEEESLLANVASLRHELKITEWSLQNLGEELSSVSPSENSDCVCNSSRSERLILEELTQPSRLGHLNYPLYKKVCKTSGSNDFQKKPRDKVSFSSTSVDQEIKSLREKLNRLRQQNACLVTQNHSLMTKIESVHFELTQSKAKMSMFESVQEQAANIPILEEQIINLEAEVSAQDKVLREAEDKLEQSQKMVIEKEHSLQEAKEECIKLKVDLLEQSKQGKRAEQQRNEALYNAEELSKAFQQYKQKVAEKLEKVQAEEELLEKNLNNCEKENKRLQEKCNLYKSELEILKEKFRQLKEEHNSGKEKLRIMAMKNSEVMSQLTESRQSVLKLESELEDKDEILREKFSLINENRELKVRVATQNERLDLCQQEIDSSRLELRSLEKLMSQMSLKREIVGFKSSLSKHQMNSFSNKEDNCIGCCEANKLMISELRIKLAIKEAEIQKLHANLTVNQLSQKTASCDDVQEGGKVNTLETEPVKLGGSQGENIKDQNHHTMNKQYEREKERLATGIEELRAKLIQIEAENSDLKVNMAHRTSQFQLIQEELLEKASNASKLENEMTKKCSQLLTLEKQLEEKIIAYSSIAAKNAELEQELMEKNEKIRSLESNINTEHEKICFAFEKAKKIHFEQHKEMEKQIERLETQLEKRDQQFKEQEKTMSILQQDILCKQHHLESLDRLLTENKVEMEKENMKKDEALKSLQIHVSEETIKVRQLDSALEICKEELALHLNQLEGNKEKFEKQLKKKSEEIYCLQKELKIKNHSLQETSEQNAILQHTLQQQQQMLQQETIRNGELEDIQTKLEKQVSKQEQELQKQRESSAEKLRKMEEKYETAIHDADLKRQKVIELTATARQARLEMDQYKEELSKMEKEIIHLKRDGENKSIHLSQLDMILDQTKTELEKKTNAVKELERLQHHTEAELTETMQKRETLETELQNAHGELKSTLRQLQELRDVLQKAQLSLEEKYTTIKDLTAELRDCKMEIEDKKQELVEMDQALKERNWELKQRAAQVTHLDMTIREHRGEMEQKIIKLEGTLEKSELELKECNKQIESLNEKLQNAKEQLREKEFIMLQNEQEISQLKKETERTQQRMKEMESVIKEQEEYIATQYKEVIDLGQELRLTQEQMQNSHSELVEARRQEVQAQREVERLSSELEDIKQLSKEKEAHGNRLAEELGASQVREAHLEARMQAEIKKLSSEVQSLKEAYHMEMISHQENHTKWKISADSQKTSVQQLNEQLEKAKLELEEAQDTVSNLHQQVQDRNEVIEAANEALLIKESELTRLQAKISGHEKTEDLKFLPASFTTLTEIMPDIQDPKFAKHSQISFFKCRKLRRSVSATDLSVKSHTNEDLSEELLQDLKKMQLEQPLALEGGHKDLAFKHPDSFKPLPYNLEDDSSESNDFSTLSGMLRYINKEVRLLKKSSLKTATGLTQGGKL